MILKRTLTKFCIITGIAVFLIIFVPALRFSGDNHTNTIQNKNEYRTISGESLLSKIKKGEKFVLFDCRPEEEYNKGHIPGAVNVSMDSYTFGRETKIKSSMEKILKKIEKDIQFVLIDSAKEEEYIPKTKLIELVKFLPENRKNEVIFYCRKPT